MKKNLSFIALLGMSIFAKAQITGPWPYAALSSQYAYFGNPNTTLPQTAVGNYALLQHNGEGYTFLNSGINGGIYFRINNEDKMYLKSDGNFGIGNINPQQKLDVNGNIVVGIPTTFTANNAGLIIFRRPSDGGTPVTMGCVSETEFAFKQMGGNSGFTFWTAGGTGYNEKMRIAYNGNVGIGTNAPLGRLHIKDGGYRQGIVFERGGYNVVRAHQYIGDGTNSTIADQVYFDALNTGYHFRQGPTGTTETVTFTKDGNVGIGTTLTTNTNNYKLAVNGTIGAKAIKVEVSSTTWSDYVFEKEYKMKSIHELETFIKTNKHLPNVPSACEVENNGIDIATMDATLLAKIEELSLYIIEQNKRIEALEKK